MAADFYRAPLCEAGFRAVVRVPGSKSITNRALLLAALAKGETVLRGALFSDDSHHLIAALRSLGYVIHMDEQSADISVVGAGTEPLAREDAVDLFVGNSGTTARFLTAMVSLGRGEYRIDGVRRMRERPIGDLLAALRGLGASVRDELGTGCPPVRIAAKGLRGGTLSISGQESSQFLSALLMAAPYADGDVHIDVIGELVSAPYVEMTVQMMRQFGAAVEAQHHTFRATPGHYRAVGDYAVEPDASGASYFLAAAAVCGGEVTILGIGAQSLQGDARFADILGRMGCSVRYEGSSVTLSAPENGLRGIDVDLFAMSDLVPTLAAIAPFANEPVTIRNVANIRLKETDRIHACVTELNKFGVSVTEFPDGLRIEPCAQLKTGVTVDTYDDHRIAMAFSILGLRVKDTVIRDPSCVNKTFPTFYDVLERALRGL